MVTADEVREVGLALPRTYEFFTGGRAKLKVRQIVYVGFSRDETRMGFGYPRDARDGLIEDDPDTFFLPPPRDLRYQWVCAHLDRLDAGEMRELVTDAWRMCTPRMLHDLPELPPPAAALAPPPPDLHRRPGQPARPQPGARAPALASHAPATHGRRRPRRSGPSLGALRRRARFPR